MEKGLSDIDMLKNLEQINLFSEQGPQSRLKQFVTNMEPVFLKVLENKIPHLEDLYQTQTLKIRNLEELRRNPSPMQVSYADQAENNEKYQQDVDNNYGASKILDKSQLSVVQIDKKDKRARSLPKAFAKRQKEVDGEMRKGYVHQLSDVFKQVFRDSCRNLLIKHPMLESAFSQIIEFEGQTSDKVAMLTPRNSKNNQVDKSYLSIQEAAVHVTLNLTSYKQFSEKVQGVIEKYDQVVAENQSLKNRISKLVAQYELETSIHRQVQLDQTDRDMQLLQQLRQQQNTLKLTKCKNKDKSDDTLDDYKSQEMKIVQVEFFNSLEGIDPEIEKQLNFKLAKVRNQFQELLEQNLFIVDKMETKIKLMNQLSPEAYSVANLSLVNILEGCAIKESDPARVWKAIKLAYGEDYFIKPVEEQYGKRFVANYNALYSEVKKVHTQAQIELAKIEEISRKEVQAQKRIVEDLRFQLSLYNENFKTKVDQIQRQTKIALKKKFQEKESRAFQAQLKNEQAMHKQITEREELCKKAKQRINEVKTRMFFDRLRMITILKRKPKGEYKHNLMKDEVKLDKIFSFLRGESQTEVQEIEEKLTYQVQALESLNEELIDRGMKINFKNTMLEDQIKEIDTQMFEVGLKVSSADNREQMAAEEQRKAIHEVRTYKLTNDHLEDIIDSHEREKQSLVNDLKRYTRGKVRSNVYEAELFRKEQQNSIVKISQKGIRQVHAGVETQKATQTTIVGLKGHVVYLKEDEYQDKFCKVFIEAEAQTLPIEIFSSSNTQIKQSENMSTTRYKKLERNNSQDDSLNKFIKSQNSQKSLVVNPKSSSSRKSFLKTKTNLQSGRSGSTRVIDVGILAEDSEESQSKKKSKKKARNTLSSSDSQKSNKSKNKGKKSPRQESFDKVGKIKQFGRLSTDSVQSEQQLGKSARAEVNTIIMEAYNEQSSPKLANESQEQLSIRKKQILLSQNQRKDADEYANIVNDVMTNPNSKMQWQSDQSNMTQGGSQSISVATKMGPLFLSQRDALDEQSNQNFKEETLGKEEKDKISSLERQKKVIALDSQKKYNRRPGTQAKVKKVPFNHNRSTTPGWRVIQERLSEIEALEKRNKSQIKYEVDKAFEMAKYLEETNFTKRDPDTSQVYTSIIQMCMSRVDQLTPSMIVNKLEKEKNDLQQMLLTVDSKKTKKHIEVAKIINFVCLENLNKQIAKIFNQTIIQTEQTDKTIIQVQTDSTDNADAESQGNVSMNMQKETMNMIDQSSNAQLQQQTSASQEREHSVMGSIMSIKQDASLSHQSLFIDQKQTPFWQQQRISRAITNTNYETSQNIANGPNSIKSTKSLSTKQSFKTTKACDSTPSQLSLVKKIINKNKRNLRVNLAEPTQQNKIIESRMAVARRFNSIEFQSLMTSTTKIRNAQIAPRSRQQHTDSRNICLTNPSGYTQVSHHSAEQQPTKLKSRAIVSSAQRHSRHMNRNSGTRSNLFKLSGHQNQQGMIFGGDVSQYIQTQPEQFKLDNARLSGSIIGPRQFAQMLDHSDSTKHHQTTCKSVTSFDSRLKSQIMYNLEAKTRSRQQVKRINNLEDSNMAEAYSTAENQPTIQYSELMKTEESLLSSSKEEADVKVTPAFAAGENKEGGGGIKVRKSSYHRMRQRTIKTQLANNQRQAMVAYDVNNAYLNRDEEAYLNKTLMRTRQQPISNRGHSNKSDEAIQMINSSSTPVTKRSEPQVNSVKSALDIRHSQHHQEVGNIQSDLKNVFKYNHINPQTRGFIINHR